MKKNNQNLMFGHGKFISIRPAHLRKFCLKDSGIPNAVKLHLSLDWNWFRKWAMTQPKFKFCKEKLLLAVKRKLRNDIIGLFLNGFLSGETCSKTLLIYEINNELEKCHIIINVDYSLPITYCWRKPEFNVFNFSSIDGFWRVAVSYCTLSRNSCSTFPPLSYPNNEGQDRLRYFQFQLHGYLLSASFNIAQSSILSYPKATHTMALKRLIVIFLIWKWSTNKHNGFQFWIKFQQTLSCFCQKNTTWIKTLAVFAKIRPAVFVGGGHSPWILTSVLF